jgi:hypothetical protein
MNTLEASIKCISIGFALGFLAGTGPNLGPDIWPFVGLLAFSAAVRLLFEFSSQEPGDRRVASPSGSMPAPAIGGKGG